MRLQQYLNEYNLDSDTVSDILETIKRDCKPFLKEFNTPLYRGLVKYTEAFGVLTPRKDRKPMNTDSKMHDIFDGVLKEIFGWKARSEALFVSKLYSTAKAYSNSPSPVLVFPIGKYKYIYSNNINDFFVDAYKVFPDGTDTPIGLVKSNTMTFYTDKGLNEAKGEEVMLKCDTYYYLKYDAIDKKTIYDELGIKI